MSDSIKTRPNVLLIMSDQHHAGVLGCAGDAVARTPHLDHLAARGLRFSNAYCASPLCGPSRMSFMTARQPCETGLWSNEEALSSDIPTFAHAFLAGGYETVLSGRMHFVGADQRHGFQHRLVGDVPESVYLSTGWKLKRVLGDLADTPGYSLAGIMKSGPGRTGYHAYDEKVTAATVGWLRERGKKPEASPFLLVAGFAAPHCPFVAPPADFAAAAARIRLEDLPEPDPNLHPWLVGMQQNARILPPPPREAQWRTRVAYYGLCAFLDRQVGAILDALTAAGLAENTLVVYTSDHGEMLGEHGLWWKSSFYEGSVRVPLLLAQPGVTPTATCCARNVSLNDVGPTLLDLAGLPPMPGVSGRSFAALLQDAASATWPNEILAELANAGSEPCPVQPRRMLKRGPWKYCHYHGAGETLFNLEDDPGERHNLAAAPQPPPVLAELRAAALAGWNPEAIEARLRTALPERALIGAWVRATQPPEPDPLWFDTPPENYVDTSPAPSPAASSSMVAGASSPGEDR